MMDRHRNSQLHRNRLPLGDVEQVALLADRLVGYILHEQQDEDVVLVLRGVHAAPQLVAAFPKGSYKVRIS